MVDEAKRYAYGSYLHNFGTSSFTIGQYFVVDELQRFVKFNPRCEIISPPPFDTIK